MMRFSSWHEHVEAKAPMTADNVPRFHRLGRQVVPFSGDDGYDFAPGRCPGGIRPMGIDARS